MSCSHVEPGNKLFIRILIKETYYPFRIPHRVVESAQTNNVTIVFSTIQNSFQKFFLIQYLTPSTPANPISGNELNLASKKLFKRGDVNFFVNMNIKICIDRKAVN